MEPRLFLETTYGRAKMLKNIAALGLDSKVIKETRVLVQFEETMKGVFSAYFSSITYKCLHPEQDIRYHKIDLPNGYSGRSFDTKHVTPFLKEKHFAGAMKESGWLTRSVEQDAPFDFNFPGKIQNPEVKQAFLWLLDYVEKNPNKAENMLICLMYYSIIANEARNNIIVKPVIRESEFQIPIIIGLLRGYFDYPYKSRGASILPVVCMYSLYEILVREVDRFKDCHLDPLASHNSADKRSGETGDIVVRKNKGNCLYEVLEIKFGIKPDSIMIHDIYKKISQSSVQRYYILSTVFPEISELPKMQEKIDEISEKHGCQIIVDNLYETISILLRIIKNPTDFINRFVYNIQNSTEINSEHKLAWNTVAHKYIK